MTTGSPDTLTPMIRRRLNAFTTRHPIWFGIIATLVWMGIVVAAVQLPPHPLYGPMYVNAIGFAAGLVVVWLLGWWNRVGLGRTRPTRSLWLVTPLLVIAATYAFPGVTADAYLDADPGDGPYILACIAVWCLLIGMNEELWSRGIILSPLVRLGPARSAVIVAVLFAGQHWLNFLFFGASLDDQLAQLVSSGTFGFALVALRWNGLSIWPLAIAHGLGDFLQLASPGAAPWWWQLAIAAFEVGYGIWMLRRARRQGLRPFEPRL